MNTKPILLIILFILLILIVQILPRPNMEFIQKIEVNKSKKEIIKNNTDVSLYRNQPNMYFPIIKEKQEAINNLYVSYYMGEDIIDEYYIKDGMRKTTTYPKINGEYKEGLTMLARGKKSYGYFNNIKLPAIDMGMFSKTEQNLPFIPGAFIPQKEVNNYKFIKTTTIRNRNCAIWQSTKYIKISNVTSTYTQCIDEDLGIPLHITQYSSIDGKNRMVLAVKEISTGTLKDKDFYIPKNIKWIQNAIVGTVFNILFHKEF